MLNRRIFLATSACASAVLGASSTAQDRVAESFPGLIIREHEPLNLEFPFATLNDLITPTNRFFVRNHFQIPKLDANSWKLRIDGAIAQPVEFSLEDIQQMTMTTQTATIECAGNGRAFLVPKAKGLLWETGGIGNAEWTGVRLNHLLDQIKIPPETKEVVFTGADEGEIVDAPSSPGRIHFERSLPIAKARQPEVLLAVAMNGKALTAEHGYPLRLIVPGWYGMASVKWLTRITVATTPFNGFWQSLEYSYFTHQQGRPTLTPVTEMLIKASVARPAQYERIPAGKDYRVYGAAWTGENEVAQVHVSVDDGEHWNEAKMLGSAQRFAWSFWEWNWAVPPNPQRYRLMARASDRRGRIQSGERDKSLRNYMINHLVPVTVASE